jgi:hypothetical protein
MTLRIARTMACAIAIASACGHAKPAIVAEPAPASGPEPEDDQPAALGAHAAARSAQEGSADDYAFTRPPSDRPRSVLTEANRVLGAVQITSYSHRTIVDEAAGRYEVDCSGLVDYVLARAAPEAFEAVRRLSVKRPLAKHYVALFEQLVRESSPHWQRIERAEDLQPGDLVAWLEPADVITSNTGHVMIVRAPVYRDRDRNELLAVPVIDSTAVPHGKGDTRHSPRREGVGAGEVLLILDGAGNPTGYWWSRGTKARPHLTKVMMARPR